jgi:predicted nucleic acid-binding protein
MILIDTNALVGLADRSDALYPQAARDLKRLRGQAIFVLPAVISEALHLLPYAVERERLRALIDELGLRAFPVIEDVQLWWDVFAWLLEYAEHEPDWVDGLLTVLSAREKRLKIWTYDREFRTIWRRPDGSRIPLISV